MKNPKIASPYPVPKRVGGTLIRKVIRLLRDKGLSLPVTSDIHITVSGGPDSTALATLLVRYGRKIVKPSQIQLLHINHGWQEGVSKQFSGEARRLAMNLGVPIRVLKLKKQPKKGDSIEALGHHERRRLFQKQPGLVFTAHHGDDLAETLLWRILTGSYDSSSEGIRFQDKNVLRPFLSIRKQDLIAFLKEEKISYLEDPMNSNENLLRGRLRSRVMPEIEGVFSKAIEHLIDLGLHQKPAKNSVSAQLFQQFRELKLPDLRVRKEWIEQLTKQSKASLPEGWEMTSSGNEVRFKRRIR